MSERHVRLADDVILALDADDLPDDAATRPGTHSSRIRALDRCAGPLVNPATRWAGATLYDGGSIAYLTARPASDDAIELGVLAHGPGSTKLVGRASELLHRWSQERPVQPVIRAYPVGTPGDELSSGAHIGRPDTSPTIGW